MASSSCGSRIKSVCRDHRGQFKETLREASVMLYESDTNGNYAGGYQYIDIPHFKFMENLVNYIEEILDVRKNEIQMVNNTQTMKMNLIVLIFLKMNF
ncbi:hypothetical protein CAEBREN_03607 [Caenorhabditis brenneri]|uniref:Uncharacterized protein n=1 Tax=Caenorhabditis brenneri TaxID=135651 RepID=G0PDV5_CAEBE|nr:hypothetical protein CAEBREN_03607 [Caenorhabditis brenneri]